MKAKICTILLLVSFGLHATKTQKLPTFESFLRRILNITTKEIENFAKSFNTRDITEKDVTFLNLTANSTKVLSKFDGKKPTKVIIHGWFASGFDEINRKLAGEYQKKGVFDVVAVDWSSHSKKNYFHAASNTKEIGKHIARFLMGSTPNFGDLHLIGHSLGAQIAGFVGKYIEKQTGKKIGRITGLDVAAPLFEIPTAQSKELKLTKSDAKIVDIIHTNAGFFGTVEPSGTADFYIENGGPIQPGCFDPINIFESFACSHYKSVDYFLDSINKKNFEAVACQNSIQYHLLACNGNRKVKMGENLPQNTTGVYYLEANSALPYQGKFEEKFQPKILLPRFL